MERVTDAFAWPVRDPQWARKVLIIGLLLVVPVLGAINGLGWMLGAIDRLRAGEEMLPPANFSYMGRGVRLFVVNLAYVLAITIAVAVSLALAYVVLSIEGRGEPNAALIVLGVLLNLLGFALGALGSLALFFVMPAVVIATDMGGIKGGLNLRGVLHRIRGSPTETLIAGLMLIAAGLIGQVGFIICVAGVFFTTAYALAMQAWIVRSYELGPSTKEE